jgi:hypothetical protein
MAAATPKITQVASTIDLTDTDVNPQAAPTSTPRQGGFTLRNRVNFANVSDANKTMMTWNDALCTTLPTVPMFILEVPERVFVKDLFVFAVVGEAVPSLDLNYIAAPANSDLTSLTLDFGAYRNRKKTNSASYAVASDLSRITTVPAGQASAVGGVSGGNVFGNLTLKVSTNELIFVEGWDAIDGSLATPAEPMQTVRRLRNTATSALGSSSADLAQYAEGEYFPYGGYVEMHFGPWNTSFSASNINSGAEYYAASTGATIFGEGVWEFQANCMYVPE